MVDSKLAGKCLAECMARKNILPKQLAERLHVTDISVYEWRNGQRTPNIHYLVDIADILDVSLDELVGRMSKTIELIDKYRIEQSCEGGYNPPSYIWEGNTGEVIRCCDCKYYDTWCDIPLCGLDIIDSPSPVDYCSRGKR